MSVRPVMYKKAGRISILLAVGLVLLLAILPAGAFQIFQPNPAAGFYVTTGAPTGSPPFLHWDLRKYGGCLIPWSINFANVPDVDLSGVTDATDQASVATALGNAAAAWQGATTGPLQLSVLGPVGGAESGLALDGANVFSFGPAAALDDFQCVAPGAPAPLPLGVAASVPFAPVITPGPDGRLNSQPLGDDMIVPCILAGGDDNADTSAVGDDVAMFLPGSSGPGGCPAVITAGPNGVLDTPLNNVPIPPADDTDGFCIVAGPDGIADTAVNNRGASSSGGALTGLFFDTKTGVILEADIEFGQFGSNPDDPPNWKYWWSVNAAGESSLQAVMAGADGILDTVPPLINDDLYTIMPPPLSGLDPMTIVIAPGPNRVIDTPVDPDDWWVFTGDLQSIATHELGHTLGISHPIDGRNSDDQQVAFPGPVPSGSTLVTPGADQLLDTMPLGDDTVVGNTIVDGGNATGETTANNALYTNGAGAAAVNNIMNPFYDPETPVSQALSLDDTMAINWLYTQDLGDAPDPYPSLIHSGAQVGTLNGLPVLQPADGPVSLLGFTGPSAPDPGRGYDRLGFERLGLQVDGSAAECEALVPDADAFDDGVVFPTPLRRGQTERFTITLSYVDNPLRYDAGDPARRLYLNGYLDFDDDGSFDAVDLEMRWAGIPFAGVEASPNLVSESFGAGMITLEFDVVIPAGAPPVAHGRFRLDYGEDEGAVADVSGSLSTAAGVAQIGEVEDYLLPTDQTDLTVALSASANPGVVGLPVQTTIDIVNNGPVPDPDGHLEIAFTGSSLTVGGATPSQGSCLTPDPTHVVCDLGLVPVTPAGGPVEATISLPLTAGIPGIVTMSAEVLSSLEDHTPGNDSASLDIAIQAFSGCDVSYTEAGIIGVWTDPDDWFPNRLPAPGDDVCIGPGFDVVYGGGTGINRLRTASPLTITGVFSSLEISAPSQVLTGGAIDLDSGTLRGSGNLLLDGPMNWTGGNILLSGGIDLAAGQVLDISGPGAKEIDDTGIISAGTTNCCGEAVIISYDPADFHNLAGAVFNAGDAEGLPASIINWGTFIRDGAGKPGFGVTNLGAVEILNGDIRLTGGTSTGTYAVLPTATVEFGGNTFAPTSIIESQGLVVFKGGVVAIQGTFDAFGGLEIRGVGTSVDVSPTASAITTSLVIVNDTGQPTLTGAGTLTVTGLLTSSRGRMTGIGTTDALGGMVLQGLDLVSRLLINAGAAQISSFDTAMADAAGIENEAGATFDLLDDTGIVLITGSTSPPFIVNRGTFSKSGGAGTSIVAAEFENDAGAMVNVNSGTLRLAGGGASAGTFNVAPGSTLRLEGTHDFGAQVTGGGLVDLHVPGTLVVEGTVAIAGDFNSDGATTMIFDIGGLTAGSQFDQLAVTGTMTLNSGLTVTLSGGFIPQVGDMFTLMTHGSRSGVFGNRSLPTLPNGRAWEVEYNPTSVILKVVSSKADLTVTKVDSVDPVLTGSPVTYTMTIINDGPDAATAVELTDTLLGPGVVVGLITPLSGSCLLGAPITCNLGSLAPMTSTTVTMTVTPARTGIITNVATVSAMEFDLDLADNTAQELTTVGPGAGLALSTLYGAAGNGSSAPAGGLFTVDPLTGVSTLINDTITPGGLSGIAFDAGGRLYGSTVSGAGSPSDLVEIDPFTGIATADVGLITPAGSSTAISIGDLAFQPGTNTLYGIRSGADGQGRAGELYTIDTTTAVATLLAGPHSLKSGAIAFTADGTLYRSHTGPFQLMTLDPASGATLTTLPLLRFYDGLGGRPEDGQLYGTSAGAILRIDPATGQEIPTSPGPADHLSDLDFLPGVPALSLAAEVTGLLWTPVAGALGYDVVRGDLGTLAATGGDFTAATDLCMESATMTTMIAMGADPPLGEGFWYFVRLLLPSGAQTYDSGSPSQVGSRDAEVNASPVSCP